MGSGVGLRSQSWAAPLGGMSWCPGGGVLSETGCFFVVALQRCRKRLQGTKDGHHEPKAFVTVARMSRLFRSFPWTRITLLESLVRLELPHVGGILPHFNVNTSLWTWAFAHRPIRRLLPGIVCTQTCKCTSPRRRITCIGKLQRTDKERLKTRTAMYDLGPSGSRVSSRRARGAV